MGEEEIKKKMEEYHEGILKNSAVTFTMEGLSKDIKFFINKKMSYNNRCMKNISSMVRSFAKSPSSNIRMTLLNEKSIINQMLQYNFEEMRTTDMILNIIVQKIFEKEVSIGLQDEDSSDSSNVPKKRTPSKPTNKPTKE